jgi:hypothetical protein
MTNKARAFVFGASLDADDLDLIARALVDAIAHVDDCIREQTEFDDDLKQDLVAYQKLLSRIQRIES